MSKPKTLQDALEKLGSKDYDEEDKWSVLAIILREFIRRRFGC